MSSCLPQTRAGSLLLDTDLQLKAETKYRLWLTEVTEMEQNRHLTAILFLQAVQP
jgi:hypothetical protein